VKRLVAGLIAVAALTLAGCASSGQPSGANASLVASGLNDNPGTGPYQGVGLVPARPRPSFTLTDTTGKTFPFATATANRATLLFFGYTNCPDICPETMADIGNAMRALPAATQKKVDVVFVSTDVKHDTGPVIATWIKNFAGGSQASFIGLHGTQAQINAAQASAHIFLAEDGGATHSTQVLLFGPDNYARDSFIFNDTLEAKQIAHDVPVVLAG
jgi:protein SCO1/2